MKRRIWLLVGLLVVLLAITACGRGRRANSPGQAAPTQAPVQATVASADQSEALADDLDKALGELESSLSGVDTIEDLEQALQGS